MITTQDIITGFDPTGLNQISTAQMLQMLNSAAMAADKGNVLTTIDDNAGNADIPNGNGTTKFQRYIWRRVGATSVIFYGWQPNVADNVSGPGMLKWVPITISAIPDNAITNGKIAPLAVTTDKIYSLSFDKVTGVPAYSLATDVYAAGNDLSGSTIAAPVVKANAITDAKLASDATDNTKRAVDVLHIKNSTAYYSLITNAAGTAVTWFLNYFAKLISVSGLGTAYQHVRVKSDVSGLEWYTPTFIKAIYSDSGGDAHAAAIPADDTPETYTHSLTNAAGVAVVPSYIRVVAYCISTEAGYAAADEVDIKTLVAHRAGFDVPNVTYWADTVNIKIIVQGGGAANTLEIYPKAGGALVAITRNKWKFKVYAAV